MGGGESSVPEAGGDGYSVLEAEIVASTFEGEGREYDKMTGARNKIVFLLALSSFALGSTVTLLVLQLLGKLP